MSQSSQSSTNRSKSKQENEFLSIKEKLKLTESSKEIGYTAKQLINHIISIETEDENLRNMYIGFHKRNYFHSILIILYITQYNSEIFNKKRKFNIISKFIK